MAGMLQQLTGVAARNKDESAGLPVLEEDLAALRDEAWELILKRFPADALLRRGDPTTEREVGRVLSELIGRKYGVGSNPLPLLSRQALVARLSDDLIGYGPLEPFLRDSDITEIMVNRWDRIAIERDGKLEKTDAKFRDERHVRDIIERMMGPAGRHIDDASPIVNARLPDGSRLNAAIPPVAPRGAVLSVRKHRPPFSEEELIELGTLTPDVVDVLKACVLGRLNMVISGGTGSGKTTLVTWLLGAVPAAERIVTCEEVAEIQTDRFHHVAMESRPSNTEGKGEVSLRDLVINALRQRPDRIVVGECRAGEAWDMLQAMSTGHPGSLTTVHADEVEEAVERLVNMVLLAGKDLPVDAVLRQIALSVDVFIQIMRLSNGRRRVVDIAECRGIGDDGRPLLASIYRMDMTTGQLVPTGTQWDRATERAARYGVTLPGG